MATRKYIAPGTVIHGWTYMGDAPVRGSHRHGWVRCPACSNVVSMRIGHVLEGRHKTCKCIRRTIALANSAKLATHNLTKSPTYRSYTSMITRCYREIDQAYPNYGGRGIKVCDRWLESFENFLADMGLRPADKTLDRKDPNKGYEPGNCRWATRKEQSETRRDSIFLEHNGRRMSLKDWAAEVGINYPTLHHRVAKLKMSPEEALTRPVEKNKFKSEDNIRIIEFNGVSRPLSEWAKILGASPHVISGRLCIGWTIERALTQPVRRRSPKA